MSEDRFHPPSRPRRVEGGIRARGTRGTIARSWWSERFIDGLESVGPAGRPARGRTYARAGQVLDLTVDAGSAVALVQGSRPAPFRVRVGLTAFGKAEWGRVEQALADDAWYTAKPLAGEMPTDIVDVFTATWLTPVPGGRAGAEHGLRLPRRGGAVQAPRRDPVPARRVLRRRPVRDPRPARPVPRRAAGQPAGTPRRRSPGRGPAPARRGRGAAGRPPRHVLPRRAPARVPPTPADALLAQLPAVGVTVRGHDLVELLRPAYRALARQP